MLRKLRITLAVACFLLVTGLFLDFTGTLHAWFGWLAKVQFVPALLALNVFVVLFLVVLTLVLGRVYCSVLCPLGVMQDAVSWLAGRFRKNRFRPSPALTWLRRSVLCVFVVAVAAGIASVVVLLEPYSAFGRMASQLLAPLWRWGNNGLAYLAERADSYAFYSVDVWVKSTVALAVAAVTFVVISILAWRGGRTYCNTICPVGTLLGYLSRHALFRIRIDTSKCNGCGLCARNCKSSCIDPKSHTVDHSRCVACMDCLGKCRQGALSYGRPAPPAAPVAAPTDSAIPPTDSAAAPSDGLSRRGFLSVSALFGASAWLHAQKKKVDGGLAVIEDKKIPVRQAPILPPGSQGHWHMVRHCTGCQLCVSACPNDVLRPSENLHTLMQPEMSYERGYCRPECTRCSEVCPAGAIHLIDRAVKTSIKIGTARWVRENCLPLTDGVSCGNCARHCPVGAITMIPASPDAADGPKVPLVDAERCIGCGACENLCPARPFSAIVVDGLEEHREV